MITVISGNVVLSAFARPNLMQSTLRINRIAIRGLTTLKFLKEKPNKPPPFPYETVKYTKFRSIFDPTKRRVDENTKLIVVDGPVGSGKKKLAKEIAEEFGLKYIPPVTMDRMYINDYGFDFRDMDDKLPASLKCFDEKKFNLDPFHFSVATFQMHKYRLRLAEYFDAMNHLMNTGQGVVLVRTAFSDFAFVEAMFHCGYMSPGAREVYYIAVDHSLYTLWRPHVIIYLDTPAETCRRNMKERGNDYEINSKALTDTFFNEMERAYKEKYLREASLNSEVLIYDWSDGGDAEVVVEDLESIDDFDIRRDRGDPKYHDWLVDEWHWDKYRHMYSTRKSTLTGHVFNIIDFRAPEMCSSGADHHQFDRVYYNSPGNEFAPGYNEKYGDTKLLWKRKVESDWHPWGGMS